MGPFFRRPSHPRDMDKPRRLTTRKTGEYWEKKAESFLQSSGLTLLKRNFNCRLGEIDLIMKDGETLVFAEVRYRKSAGFGTGAETVSEQKQSRIIKAALIYLGRNTRYNDAPCRFDVVSVGNHDGQVRFTWIKHAFEVQRV